MQTLRPETRARRSQLGVSFLYGHAHSERFFSFALGTLENPGERFIIGSRNSQLLKFFANSLAQALLTSSKGLFRTNWVSPTPMSENCRHLTLSLSGGQIYLFFHEGSEAAAEFGKFVDRGDPTLSGPLVPLAYLGLARAYALQGDRSKPEPRIRIPRPLEGRRPGHPHPEESQGRVCEAPVSGPKLRGRRHVKREISQGCSCCG